ncbi:sodium/hydrogen exchanger 3 isoform X2 [Lingula anatina]|uniref:Sodium/hydrogen exchanger n=1 Tax=Lingula anatina TaxID=7574 RepID=A0A1S3K073_LINAN|nr:sodium/hydrogen exchanger 3 isoform X2 [Lingula anatina]|eukprot:XP_013416033.1 sodium/hydrogen exchanger 3 isoform X2 [Lingula anatina]
MGKYGPIGTVLLVGIQVGFIFCYEMTVHNGLEDEDHIVNVDGSSNESHANHTQHEEHSSYHVVVWDFARVASPFVISAWILLASVAKIGFHLYNKLSSIFPESCLLIVLGVIIGVILYLSNASKEAYTLNAETFFLFLLPPIVLEAGYFMPSRAFFDNIGTILMFAVVGTLFNTFCIGGSLYAFSGGVIGLMDIRISFLHCLVFSSLISAVDPVAVLAVFEEIQVNEVLYIIVFGESLLNDAVTVVLYHMFETYSHIGEDNITAQDVLAGIASFCIVGIGGTLVGVIYGLITAFITRYTDHVRVIEPLFVFVMSYLSYLTAEIFHLSGIMAIVFCAITMKRYVEANISQKSHTTIKYFMKMISSVSETVIFVFLGLSTVVDTHDFNVGFVLLTLVFTLIYRVIGVIIQCAIVNRFRLLKLSKVDQFVMSYGGLRGAIAFCLVILLDAKVIPEKRMMITACIVVVFFTVFVQGITIKPLVNILKVKKSEKHKPSMNEQLHERAIDHAMAGIEDITGHHGHHHLRDKFENYDNKYLKPLLLRERPVTRETKIVKVSTNLSLRDAMDHLAKHGSFAVSNDLYNGNETSLAKLIRNYSASSLHFPLGYMPPAGLSHSQQSDHADREGGITPNSTCIDMQAIEAHYCKKIADDTKIHHILDNSLFKPRKRWTKHQKHELDTENHAPFRHKARQHIRHMISQHQMKRNANKAKVNKNGTNGKSSKNGGVKYLNVPGEAVQRKPTKNVSFADDLDTEGKDHREPPVKCRFSDVTEDKEEDSDSSSEAGIMFTAGPTEDEESEPGEDTPLISEATPTAVEKQLPWKRNSGRQPISSSLTHSLPDDDIPRMSECPSWVDNLDYNHISSSPAASLNISPNNSRSMPVLSVVQQLMQPAVLEEEEDEGDTVAMTTENSDKDVNSDMVEKVVFSAGSEHEHEGNSGIADASKEEKTDVSVEKQNEVEESNGGLSFSLPWRRQDDESDQGPVRSPSASHIVDSSQNFAPLPSNRSFTLSEREECLESKHLKPINLQSVISLPKYNDTYPDSHDVFLEQSDVLKSLPQSDDLDPDDRIHKWLQHSPDDLGSEEEEEIEEEMKKRNKKWEEGDNEPLEVVVVPNVDTSSANNCDNTGDSTASEKNCIDSSRNGSKSNIGLKMDKTDPVKSENKSSSGFVLDCGEGPTAIIVVDDKRKDQTENKENDAETYV